MLRTREIRLNNVKSDYNCTCRQQGNCDWII